MLLLVDEVTMTSEVGLVSSSLVGSSGVLRSAAGSTIGGGHEGGGIRVGVGRQGRPAVGAKGWGGGIGDGAGELEMGQADGVQTDHLGVTYQYMMWVFVKIKT